MNLPQPDDMTSLVLRTDFSNDAAWETVQAAVDGAIEYRQATYVSDPDFAGVSIRELVDADNAASDDEKLTYLFLADTATMADEEYLLLAVDLFDEPGRAFRVPPYWFADIAANLSIANMDFSDFADSVDGTGTFRGFAGG